MDKRFLPIRDQLEFACMQTNKDDMAIECIELSYDALDTLIATDPMHMRHVAFGRIEWQGIKIKPMDGFMIDSNQYRLITRPLKPSEAGHTIRGKLPMVKIDVTKIP